MDLHLLILLIIVCDVVYGLHNVTVDDQDSSISYLPPEAWFRSANSSLDSGGSHMLTQNGNGTATFNFTGVAIYFLSPLWPYLVNTVVSLDSNLTTLIDLVDHSRPDTGGFGSETVQSQVVWAATGLNNTQHILIMSVGAGQPFAIVDGLIYTVSDPPNLNSTITTSTSLATSTPPTAASSGTGFPNSSSALSSQKHALPIALGTILGTLGVLLVGLFFWCFIRRRRRPLSEAWTMANASKSTPSPTSGPSPISLGPPATYPMARSPRFIPSYGQVPSPPNFDQSTWQNPRYGYVGVPAQVLTPPTFAPLISPYMVHYEEPQDTPEHISPYHEELSDAVRSPARYMHGVTLSTITENSPSIAEGAATLANSPASSPSELASSGRNEVTSASEGLSSADSGYIHTDFSRNQRDGTRTGSKHALNGTDYSTPQYATNSKHYRAQTHGTQRR